MLFGYSSGIYNEVVGADVLEVVSSKERTDKKPLGTSFHLWHFIICRAYKIYAAASSSAAPAPKAKPELKPIF